MMTIEGEKRRASPDSLADEMSSPKRIELCPPHDQDVSMEEVEVVNTTASSLKIKIEEPFLYVMWQVDRIIDDSIVRWIAGKVIDCGGDIVRILEDFIDTVSESTITNHHALQHFDKVKAIWGNKHFIEFLMKMDDYVPDLRVTGIISSVSLSFFLVPEIGRNADIFEYKDQTTMMRNALSILIGYWSNEEMILLMLSIGGPSLRSRLDVVKVDDVFFRWGEEVSGNKMSREFSTPIEDCSPIEELRNDSSIKELANKLVKIPVAVRLAENYLEALKGDEDEDTTSYDYHRRHCLGASCFWSNPVVLTVLVEALQEEPLVNIFKKYSKRAQCLRCLDRLTRIQKNSLVKDVLEGGDIDHKMRGAFSVLFAYWSDYDVCQLYHNLLDSRYTFEEGDDIQVVEYFRQVRGDFEGLRKVLADKYSRYSREYTALFRKISKFQKMKEKILPKKKERVIEFPRIPDLVVKSSAVIRVLLRNSDVMLMEIIPI